MTPRFVLQLWHTVFLVERPPKPGAHHLYFCRSGSNIAMVHDGEEGCVSNLIKKEVFQFSKLLMYVDLDHVVTLLI